MHGRERAARFSSKLESGQGCLLNKRASSSQKHSLTHGLKTSLKLISLRLFTTPALRLLSATMQDAQHPEGAANPARPSTINSSTLLSNPLKRLPLNTASNTPLPPSPGPNSPRRVTDQQRFEKSPSAQKPPPSPLQRSSSTMSLYHR